MHLRYAAVIAALIAAAAVLLIPASGQAGGGGGHTLTLANSPLVGSYDDVCPAGTPDHDECVLGTTEGAVPGLGTVRENYLTVETPLPSDSYCYTWSSHPALRIARKGTIDLSVQTPPGACIDTAISGPLFAPLVFTVTGGQGLYANASGKGTLVTCIIPFDFYAKCPSGADTPDVPPLDEWFSDTLNGTLVAPNATFDTTPPTIRGAVSKKVRAPKGKRRVRVRFAVTARDTVDGTVPVRCKPHSRSRFKLGRTKVACSATDTSANKATARFTVTVKKHR